MVAPFFDTRRALSYTVPMKIVLVTWKDIVTEATGWVDKPDAHKAEPDICYSVGFLIHSDQKKIVIAMSESDEEINHTIVIPRGAVTNVQTLKEPRRAKRR